MEGRLTGLEPVHQYDFLTPSFDSLNIRGRACTYAIPLPFDTIVPYHLVGEALTGHIVSDVRLPVSAVTLHCGVDRTYCTFMYTWFPKTCVGPSTDQL